MSIADLCATYVKQRDGAKGSRTINAIDFIEAPWGLGLGTVKGIPPLHPVQKILIKCYYGIELDNGINRNIKISDKFNREEIYRFNEAEYIDFLYNEGRCNIKEVTRAYVNMLMVCGRRSGKTTITAAIIAYEMYKLLNMYSPQEYYTIMPDSEIKMTCVSTSKRSASELFNMATGNMMRSDFFKRFRREPTKETMEFQTQREVEKYGTARHSKASLLLRVAACSAKGLRGPSNALVGLDEMAHFFEEEKITGAASSDMSERAIYDAVTPSVANFTTPDGHPDGKILCLSSPSTKSGKFYELYENSFKEDVDDWLMIQAPTWEVNPSVPHQFLLGKYKDGPIVYNVEYGAQFDDRLKGWIEDAEVIRQCIVPGLDFKIRSNERLPHFLGVDVGLKKDGTAMCVCHNVVESVHGARETFIEVDLNDVRFAEEEKKLHFKPQDIAEWIMDINSRFLIVKGLMDQYYGMGIVPLLEDKGLKQFEYRVFNEQMNSNIYQNLLTQFISMSLKLPEGKPVKVGDKIEKDSELVKELLSLQAHHKSKYIIKVEAPDREGCHDDRSDALVRAVLLATEYKTKGYGSKMASVISERAKAFRNANRHRALQASLLRPVGGSMPNRMGLGMGMGRNSMYGGYGRR